jgi:serine/threonine-protein kinase
MDADRWQRISRLYHDALERPGDQRDSFLDSCCQGDEALRGEVALLLAHEASTQSVANPAAEVVNARRSHSSEQPPIGLEPGVSLGTYRIERRLGRGGMGVVFLAHDTTLHRKVALKVLGSATEDATARDGLLREGRNAAALNHPNICTVYEVGNAQGRAFIAMEYVDGQPLSDRLSQAALPLGEAVRYGIEVADALCHHWCPQVSPPVRPTPWHQNKSGAASRMRGRTSALGVLLYEMVSGARPFAAPTVPELFSSILRDAPAPLPAHVSSELAAVIERCLHRDVSERYQRGSEVQAALEAIQTGNLPAAVVRRPQLGRHRLAVLPLHNVSGDPGEEYFVDGTHDALITDLGGIHALRVIARSSVMRYKGSEASLPEIAAQLNADTLLTGSVMRLGDHVRITAQLIDAATEELLWGSRYERQMVDVLSLQNEIVAAIARAIAVQLSPAENKWDSRQPVKPRRNRRRQWRGHSSWTTHSQRRIWRWRCSSHGPTGTGRPQTRSSGERSISTPTTARRARPTRTTCIS